MSTNQQRREAAKRKLERQRERREQRARQRKRAIVVVSAATAVVLVLVVVLFSLHSQNKATGSVAAAPNGPCSFPPTPDQPAARAVSPPTEANPPRQGTVVAMVTTNRGALPITLDRAEAPCTVASFISLSRAGFYHNTPCHRLVTGGSLNVLQCGDPTGTGTGGPGYTIPDEPPTGLRPGPDGASLYPAGAVAMANTGAPHSGGSQFFLVYADSYLPPNYTLFGTVAPAGIQVLRTIAAAGDDESNGPGDGRPKLATNIQDVTVAG